MSLTFRNRKPEKQLQHSRTESSRKQREKTERQRPGERKRRRWERDGASAPSFPGPQGRPPFIQCRIQIQAFPPGIKKPLPGLSLSVVTLVSASEIMTADAVNIQS